VLPELFAGRAVEGVDEVIGVPKTTRVAAIAAPPRTAPPIEER
jgi:hypothetical protein